MTETPAYGIEEVRDEHAQRNHDLDREAIVDRVTDWYRLNVLNSITDEDVARMKRELELEVAERRPRRGAHCRD